MLQIKDLSVFLEINNRFIIRNFTFHLAPGHRAAIIGEEGNGKSTLLKLLHDPGLIEAYAGYTGKVLKPGLKTGYLPQELSEEEAGLDVYTYMCREPAFLESAPGELNTLARAVGTAPEIFYSERPVHSFSGGERIKLAMARVMVGKPDVYLLDEPTNDLDIKAIQWLEDMILSLDRPVLYISHDELLLERTANCIIHLEQLRKKNLARSTVFQGGYREYLLQRSQAFAHQAQMAKSEQDEYRRQMERWRQIYQRVDHAQRTISRADPQGGRLLKKKMKSVLSTGRRLEREAESRTQMPEYEEAIGLAFDAVDVVPGKLIMDFTLDALRVEDRILARGLQLPIRSGAHIGIVGGNGAGKTTLLRILARQLLDKYGDQAAYMPQNYEEQLDFSMPVLAFLAPSGQKEDITRARTFMGSLRYTHEEMEASASRLSGGQKAKLYFLKMALQQPQILILDEPTRNLSPLSGPVVRQTLSAYSGTIVSVSHDRKYLQEVCNQVFRLGPCGLYPEEV